MPSRCIAHAESEIRNDRRSEQRPASGIEPSGQSTMQGTRTFGSLRVGPFESRHEQGRLAAGREHQHREPLGDRRGPVPGEPHEVGPSVTTTPSSPALAASPTTRVMRAA